MAAIVFIGWTAVLLLDGQPGGDAGRARQRFKEVTELTMIVFLATGAGLLGGSNLKFFVAGGVIALAVAYLVLMGLQGTTVYFLTVSELQAKGPAAQNQLYRVSGMLVPGTLSRESSGLGIHFQIADDASS